MAPLNQAAFISTPVFLRHPNHNGFATTPILGHTFFIPFHLPVYRQQRVVLPREDPHHYPGVYEIGQETYNVPTSYPAFFEGGSSSSVIRRHVSSSMVSAEIARIGIAVYGVLMAGGGIGAFLKSGSKPSVISGVSAGIVLAFMYAQDNVQGALITAAILAVVFAIRLVKTKKFVPAGLLLTLSIVAAVFFAASVYG